MVTCSGAAQALIAVGIACLASADGSDRFLHVSGDAAERGIRLGEALRPAIFELLEVKKKLYAARSGFMDTWEAVAKAAKPLVAEHAPVAYAELQGAAQVVGEDALWLLMTEYEMFVHSRATDTMVGKCTGFAARFPGEKRQRDVIVAGQTNDEPLDLWVNGMHDLVILYDSKPDENIPRALAYTHPGYAAYMGINSAGLSVLWQYVDNTERNLFGGVPTMALIREMLTYRTAESASEYLKRVPRAIPNTFILTDYKKVISVELTPTRHTTQVITKGAHAHANHFVFDQDAMDDDVQKNSKSSHRRFDAMRSAAKSLGERVSVGLLQEALSQPPIERPADDCNCTLATIVFDQHNLEMTIRFKGDMMRGQTGFRVYHFPEGPFLNSSMVVM